MKFKSTVLLLTTIIYFPASAYEINNHADMSQEAAFSTRSLTECGVRGATGCAVPYTVLSRLGLKAREITDARQTFPLGQNAYNQPLGPIPYCFGSERPFPTFKVTTNQVLTQQAGIGLTQPAWNANGGTRLTIAELIRYGACFEDEEEPAARSISHFYNPQNQGAGATLGPSSLKWMLGRDTSLTSGPNHFSYSDARDAFFGALTGQDANTRALAWGKTFQSLGHLIHHLQDMASPQHVRGDYHCNNTLCRDALFGLPNFALNLYRPSSYETYFEQPIQVRAIRTLAQGAGSPIVLNLPRQFWNANTANDLSSSNLARSRRVRGLSTHADVTREHSVRGGATHPTATTATIA